MTAREVYSGSDGAVTKQYYLDLAARGGVRGLLAVDLFRAQKASARAKLYRGGVRGVGSYRSMAYERKGWALKNLAARLLSADGIRFGWKLDPAAVHGNAWVIYIDLPQGQVSFHSPGRYQGPDYAGEWDGKHESVDRIMAFCDEVYRSPDPRQMELL